MTAIETELKECIKCLKYMSNDLLEAYIDYAAIYSKECWLILLEERLRRMENEIIII